MNIRKSQGPTLKLLIGARGLKSYILILTVVIAPLTVWTACARDAQQGSTGSMAFAVSFPSSSQSNRASTVLAAAQQVADCSALGIMVISVIVSNNAGFSTAQDFSCETHQGTIANIPAGTGYTVVIQGRTLNSVSLYTGSASGQTVAANTVNQVQGSGPNGAIPVDLQFGTLEMQCPSNLQPGQSTFVGNVRLKRIGTRDEVGVEPLGVNFAINPTPNAYVSAGGGITALNQANVTLTATLGTYPPANCVINITGSSLPRPAYVLAPDNSVVHVVAGRSDPPGIAGTDGDRIHFTARAVQGNDTTLQSLQANCGSIPGLACQITKGTQTITTINTGSDNEFFLNVTASPDTAPNIYPISISGSAFGQPVSTTVAVQVYPKSGAVIQSTAGFKIEPLGRTVTAGLPADFAIVAPNSTGQGAVDVLAQDCSGLSCSLNPSRATPDSPTGISTGSNGTLRVVVPTGMSPGTKQLIVANTAGTLTRTAFLTVSSQPIQLISKSLTGNAPTAFATCTLGAANACGSGGPFISGNGRFISFSGWANNLTSNDANNFGDVFLWDRDNQQGGSGINNLTLVSVGINGNAGNAESTGASISDDGATVVFHSKATNLVNLQTSGIRHVFHRAGGVTRLVDLGSNGVSEGNANAGGDDATSGALAVSNNGQFVAFRSKATNLVAGQTVTPGVWNIYLWDRNGALNSMRLISQGINGASGNNDSENPAISNDGRYVTFDSCATNLVTGISALPADGGRCGSHVYFWDRDQTDPAQRITLVSKNASGTPGTLSSNAPDMSGDGKFVAFESAAPNLVSGDTNNNYDVFLWDRVQNTIVRVSIGPNGEQGDALSTNPTVTDDGRYVSFDSQATTFFPNLSGNYNIFLRDTQTQTLSNITFGSSVSRFPQFSADGRILTFVSSNDNLVPNIIDTNGRSDVFLVQIK